MTVSGSKGGFPLGEFFRAKRKACFDFLVLLKVLLHNLKMTCSKQKDKNTLFASREKSRVVENRLKTTFSDLLSNTKLIPLLF